MSQEPEQPKKARVRARRTVLTFSCLRAAAHNALSQAEQTKEGQYYNLMLAMLSCAFSLEALLNHIGREKVDFWDAVERKSSPSEKLRILGSVIGFTPDMKSSPFQTFVAAFRFRNTLVHGKTQKLQYDKELVLPAGDRPDEPKTWWEGLLTLGTARKWLDDTREMTRVLYEKAGYSEECEEPYWTLGSVGWHIQRGYGWQGQ